jgi:starch phosphorylase
VNLGAAIGYPLYVTALEPRTAAGRGELARSIEAYLALIRGKSWERATRSERLDALSLAIRKIAVGTLEETEARYVAASAKRLYYLSMEFLMGRSLGNNIGNLGLTSETSSLLATLHEDLASLEDAEQDAALGNGGLGRLAACFLDSLATLGMPGFGYGINYEFGLFKQTIDDGFQHEKPDQWNASNSPWLIDRPEEALVIPVYGKIEHALDRRGEYNPMWLGWKIIVGVPHDMPVIGYGGRTVNVLRLFSARSSDEFDMEIFNSGDYLRAVEQKIGSETVSKVLYPSDAVASGRELRLIQEYFLVACAVRDMLRRFQQQQNDIDSLDKYVALQLNDTHPALTVAELMRTLVDENDIPWERAWEITVATLGYTNHTLLPEALEKWPVELMELVLPRHMQIIFEINRRFMERLKMRGIEKAALSDYSIIEETPTRQVRMANLAIAGSHSVNGVAALHTELLKQNVVPHFASLWPERFTNKTNGVTPRRWLLHANPRLASLLTEAIGDGWVTDLDELRKLEPLADSASFLERLGAIKLANKVRLAAITKETTGITIDPQSFFDVQIKRIHEYKRQLLNVLHIMHRYAAIVERGETPLLPRTFIFAGKAAPGYLMAKRIIKLVHSVAELVNGHPRASQWLRVVFLPDYRVTLAERIVPAAELSEQISTAGKEASGTGNMKLAMNGAVTVGTLDGANVEIMQEVGSENIFIFGLTAEEVSWLINRRAYEPWALVNSDPRIRSVMDLLRSEALPDHEFFGPIFEKLSSPNDEYLHLADLPAYIDIQQRIDGEYHDKMLWNRKALLNIARIGKFSSDRTIREYARDVWGIRSH